MNFSFSFIQETKVRDYSYLILKNNYKYYKVTGVSYQLHAILVKLFIS
jgi:hypothetical protein